MIYITSGVMCEYDYASLWISGGGEVNVVVEAIEG